jgi:hypothetical protein
VNYFNEQMDRRKQEAMMKCEEFEVLGLDMDRADAKPEEAASAANHAANCARCSALLESWRELKQDLRVLRETTRLESAPARVEMRLKQELRTRREARVPSRTVRLVSWALPAAAALAIAIAWTQRQTSVIVPVNTTHPQVAAIAQSNPHPPAESILLASDNDSGDFTQLPASMPTASSEEAIVQARVQRGALMQFGLPVEPEQASDWVDVDFLVGEDGQPLAVRLHQDSQNEAVTQ